MKFSSKLLILLGFVLLFQNHLPAQSSFLNRPKMEAPFTIEPQVKMSFKGMVSMSVPLLYYTSGMSHTPGKYFVGVYRMLAMGVNYQRHEIVTGPVFIFMPSIYTVGSRGMLLDYKYDITSPEKKNVIYGELGLIYSSIIYRYATNTDNGLMERTFEGSLRGGFQHNFSKHINISAYSGLGQRSTKVRGFHRPLVTVFGCTLGYSL